MTENNRGAENLQKLLDEGWAYHDRESERLASELETAAEAGVSTHALAPFLHLSTHTIGEHLGDWARALRLGKRVLGGRTPTPETAKGWASLQIAATLAGDPVEAAALELAYLKVTSGDLGAAVLNLRFMLIGALLNSNRITEATQLYGSAVVLVDQSPSSETLDRTIAAVSNNLGWELHEMTQRSPETDRLMRLCAETGLIYWLKCGNWINEERALYFRARVANLMGDYSSALADADKALALIDSQGQRPLDAALLHLARASALGALGDEQGKLRTITDADAAAARLTAPDLQAQFASERAKVLATVDIGQKVPHRNLD